MPNDENLLTNKCQITEYKCQNNFKVQNPKSTISLIVRRIEYGADCLYNEMHF